MSSSKEKSIKLLIRNKTEYESKLNIILKRYFIKYFKELYEETNELKEFQIKLYKIPKWSSDKISREFGYFTKYVNKKYDLTDTELSKILDIIYSLNIKIMTSLFDYIHHDVPKFKLIWYKCIKKFGKFFYENPKLIKDIEHSNESFKYLDDTVKNVIQNFIPIKEIINTKKQHLDKYDFENQPYSEKSIINSKSITNSNSKQKLEIELRNTDDSKHQDKLNYADTSDFENEYCNSQEDNLDKKKLDKNKIGEDKDKDEEKQIKLPKYLFNKKKNFFNLSKMKKKNEMDEHFFD